jgi:hypothetical protein
MATASAPTAEAFYVAPEEIAVSVRIQGRFAAFNTR